VGTNYSGRGVSYLAGSANMNQVPYYISSDPVELGKISRTYQNYRPDTRFGSINLEGNSGHNTCNVGTLRVEKPMSSGFMMNAFYTLSKTIDGNIVHHIIVGHFQF
jgi:hypothetical protein